MNFNSLYPRGSSSHTLSSSPHTLLRDRFLKNTRYLGDILYFILTADAIKADFRSITGSHMDLFKVDSHFLSLKHTHTRRENPRLGANGKVCECVNKTGALIMNCNCAQRIPFSQCFTFTRVPPNPPSFSWARSPAPSKPP